MGASCTWISKTAKSGFSTAERKSGLPMNWSKREKRYGQSVYPVMYANFKKDFGIKKGKWTQIWEWPEVCAEQIIQYLDDKYHNTIAGRIKKAAMRPGYIHKRPYLFQREKEFLSQLELAIQSQEVKNSLKTYFGVTSHKNLTNLEHWQWVCYLEKEVAKIYEEDDDKPVSTE